MTYVSDEQTPQLSSFEATSSPLADTKRMYVSPLQDPVLGYSLHTELTITVDPPQAVKSHVAKLSVALLVLTELYTGHVSTGTATDGVRLGLMDGLSDG